MESLNVIFAKGIIRKTPVFLVPVANPSQRKTMAVTGRNAMKQHAELPLRWA
jgi:hypothetical protein